MIAANITLTLKYLNYIANIVKFPIVNRNTSVKKCANKASFGTKFLKNVKAVKIIVWLVYLLQIVWNAIKIIKFKTNIAFQIV